MRVAHSRRAFEVFACSSIYAEGLRFADTSRISRRYADTDFRVLEGLGRYVYAGIENYHYYNYNIAIDYVSLHRPGVLILILLSDMMLHMEFLFLYIYLSSISFIGIDFRGRRPLRHHLLPTVTSIFLPLIDSG